MGEGCGNSASGPRNSARTAWASGGSATSGRGRERALSSGPDPRTPLAHAAEAAAQGMLRSAATSPLPARPPRGVRVELSEAPLRGEAGRSARALLRRGAWARALAELS